MQKKKIGRPRLSDKGSVHTTVRLESDLWQRLNDLAADLGVPLSAIIRTCVERHLPIFESKLKDAGLIDDKPIS